MTHTYYLEISKDAGMSEFENGDPAETLLTVSFESDQTNYTEQQIIRFIEKQTDIPAEYLKLITKEEYEEQKGEA